MFFFRTVRQISTAILWIGPNTSVSNTLRQLRLFTVTNRPLGEPTPRHRPDAFRSNAFRSTTAQNTVDPPQQAVPFPRSEEGPLVERARQHAQESSALGGGVNVNHVYSCSSR